jgi:hypothetical protein
MTSQPGVTAATPSESLMSLGAGWRGVAGRPGRGDGWNWTR